MAIATITPQNNTQTNLLANALNGSSGSLAQALNAAIQRSSLDMQIQQQQGQSLIQENSRRLAREQQEKFDMRNRMENLIQMRETEQNNDVINAGRRQSQEFQAENQDFLRSERGIAQNTGSTQASQSAYQFEQRKIDDVQRGVERGRRNDAYDSLESSNNLPQDITQRNEFNKQRGIDRAEEQYKTDADLKMEQDIYDQENAQQIMDVVGGKIKVSDMSVDELQSFVSNNHKSSNTPEGRAKITEASKRLQQLRPRSDDGKRFEQLNKKQMDLTKIISNQNTTESGRKEAMKSLRRVNKELQERGGETLPVNGLSGQPREGASGTEMLLPNIENGDQETYSQVFDRLNDLKSSGSGFENIKDLNTLAGNSKNADSFHDSLIDKGVEVSSDVADEIFENERKLSTLKPSRSSSTTNASGLTTKADNFNKQLIEQQIPSITNMVDKNGKRVELSSESLTQISNAVKDYSSTGETTGLFGERPFNADSEKERKNKLYQELAKVASSESGFGDDLKTAFEKPHRVKGYGQPLKAKNSITQKIYDKLIEGALRDGETLLGRGDSIKAKKDADQRKALIDKFKDL